jgi:hypothetical protein
VLGARVFAIVTLADLIAHDADAVTGKRRQNLAVSLRLSLRLHHAK